MLKLISLGGYGEVTRNMYAYIYQEKQVLLVDCGIGFPTEEMLGVDLLIPDINYLLNQNYQIQGLILTHGHEDHIGGLPYILDKLPEFPVYGARLTAALAQIKLDERKIRRKIKVFDSNSHLKLGPFEVDFARVSHSIPDTYHLIIHTPEGVIYHGVDFKFDFTPVDGIQPQLSKIALASQKGVKLMLSDCLGSERKGATPSELSLNDMFEREISHCPGKFIVTAMSSSISRWQQAIDVSIKYGRQIVLAGRSVEKNVEVARKLGYLKVEDRYLVPLKKAHQIPDNLLTVLIAGSQGQEGAALHKLALGEHRYLSINPGDKVVFSTDYIPGSELAIHWTVDTLYELGATVIYADVKDDLHVSGHGSQWDLKTLINLVSPEYIYPIGGTYRHMVHYARLAQEMGYGSEQIIFPQGKEILIEKGKVRLGQTVPLRAVMIDGLSVGDVGQVVLRDRQVLAEEGVVMAIIKVDMDQHKLVDEIELISRGFIYAQPNRKLMSQAKKQLTAEIQKATRRIWEPHVLKKVAVSSLQRFFARQLQRHPMIVPVLIEV